MILLDTMRAIGSVTMKEFLHVWRDRRILVLILVLPPLLTLIFGHAFGVTDLKDIPALIVDQDQSDGSRELKKALSASPVFHWKTPPKADQTNPNLLKEDVQAALVIPHGWGEGLVNGSPIPLKMIVDGTDVSTAYQIEGILREILGAFQRGAQHELFKQLPQGALEAAFPLNVQRQFASVMTPWNANFEVRYNPKLRFIEFVTPGILGLIMQLMTVTLMACTITRERESGTLSQLLITSLHRGEIVAGKVLPYLCISLFLISSAGMVARFYFDVPFIQPLMLGVLNFLFLACSLGLGLLISAFCTTQAQAIQFSVFFLLPVFPLSGAFASLDQLPPGIRMISEAFPLTHYCRAFRLINLRNAQFSYIEGDLLFLLAGALLTCAGAAYLLSRAEE